MGFLEIFLISLSMAMDAFAVCLGLAAARQCDGPRPTFRLSFHFGLFQFLMPILGWFAGMTVVKWINAFDHWVAFGLLAFVGGRMILAGFNHEQEANRNDPSRGWNLVILSVAVSIDALAIGLSLAMVHVDIWYPAVVIGIVTSLISLLGLNLGGRLSARFGKRMEVIGGLVLVLIGVRILISHLFGW